MCWRRPRRVKPEEVAAAAAAAEEERLTSAHAAEVDVVMGHFSVRNNDGTALANQDRVSVDRHGEVDVFSIFAGHKGAAAADWCCEQLHRNLLALPAATLAYDHAAALEQAYVQTDVAFLNQLDQIKPRTVLVDGQEVNITEDLKNSGSVGATVMVAGTTLYCASVGDCRAVLCRNGAPVELSTPHRATGVPTESERVAEAGGQIIRGRLGGDLLTSRSFGDRLFKLTDGESRGRATCPRAYCEAPLEARTPVTAVPTVRVESISEEDAEGRKVERSGAAFVFLASPALAELLDAKEMCELITERLPAPEVRPLKGKAGRGAAREKLRANELAKALVVAGTQKSKVHGDLSAVVALLRPKTAYR